MLDLSTIDLVIWGLLAIYWVPKIRRNVPDSLRFLDDDPDSSPVDEVHQAYLDGEIDESELECRLEVLVDDRAATIRDMADDVDGIGEELSRDIAREFDTVADLHAADVEDIQRVDGVGEKRAEKLLEEL